MERGDKDGELSIERRDLCIDHDGNETDNEQE
jgi:hypothetical protein